MVLASLRISERCVEMVSFDGYMIGGNYCSISTFMLSHYGQTHTCLVIMGIHARLFGSMQYHACATACLSSCAGTNRSVFV